MKVIFLSGGLGTRISEETSEKPKPMVEIAGRPILWHLMNIFAMQGFDEFVLALGYKKEAVKTWIENLTNLNGETIKHPRTSVYFENYRNEKFPWSVTGLDTGIDTQTGGRISLCMEHLAGERVLVTYGDGLANVNISKLIQFHNSHGKLATVTAVHPPARFGYMNIVNSRVTQFNEKNQADAGWINGGFFILEPEVANYVKDLREPFETGALPRLVGDDNLMAFAHEGFWQPMDTLREKHILEKMALQNVPPWLAQND